MEHLKDFDRRVLLAGVGGIVAGSLLAGEAKAGKLEPPAGPPQSNRASFGRISAKIARTTSGYAEPRTPVQSLASSATAQYVITSSGSYYLTDNIQGVSGLNGIEIAANDVDLDLCGFHLHGSPPDPTGLPGGTAIVCATRNVCVYDGTLVGWQQGVDFGQASLFILWDVTSIDAVSNAFVLGSRGQAYDCDACSCPGTGFTLAGIRTLVEECGAWSCSTGFRGINSPNLLLSNCATECSSAFELSQGCAYGPIVVVTGGGDISAMQGSSHPSANLVY